MKYTRLVKLLIAIILLYVVVVSIALIGQGILESPFLFAVLFPFFTAIAFFCVLSGILSCCLPVSTRKEFFIVSLWTIWVMLGSWILNRYLLSTADSMLKLIGTLGLLLFTIYIARGMRMPQRKTFYRRMIVFGVFLMVLKGITSITDRTAETNSMENLGTLPYATWVPTKDSFNQTGVTLYDSRKAFPGINIYTSRNAPSAHLVDMTGKILHTWKTEIDAPWNYVKMCQNGDLLAIVKDEILIRMDWDSKIQWVREGRFHHEITLDENEDIYALVRKEELVFLYGLPVPILHDYIAIFAPNGILKVAFPVFNLVKDAISFRAIFSIYATLSNPQNTQILMKRKQWGKELFPYDSAFDILHTNALTLLDRDVEGLGRQGDLLISVRQLDLIGTVDMENGVMFWTWGPGELSRQHHPTLLENGHILIFDNGVEQRRSRVIELNPHTREIVWQYESPDFYSPSRGSSQRLSNGNTLITDSDSGYVFEVTHDGEIVWEFYNPEQKGVHRAAIYRFLRITDPERYPRFRTLEMP